MEFSRLTVSQRRALAAVVLAVVGLVAVDRLTARHAAPARSYAPVRAAEARPRLRNQLVVYVAGAVRRPGLYRLAPGTRIADLLALAGGATRRADLVAVNLAAPLADGEEVVVPRRGGSGAAAASGAVPSPTAPLDLNSASLEQLDALPGIGPTTAQKILAYRQAHGAFHSLADLDAVPGIGPARIEQLKGLVLP